MLTYRAAAALGCVILPIVHIFGPAELRAEEFRARVLILPDRWRHIDYLDTAWRKSTRLAWSA